MHLKDFIKISDYEWEIPTSFRKDMRVPVRVFASEELLLEVLEDKSLEQAVNAATLPGLVGRVLVMPDVHQGYGFPIGGVAATEYPHGVISPGAIGYDINCLSGDTPILCEHGYTRPLAEVVHARIGGALRCFNNEKRALESARPLLFLYQSPKAPVLRLTTESGKTLTATADHPIWTKDGMVPCGQLKVGDEVAVSPFEGVPFAEAGHRVLVDEEMLRALSQQLNVSRGGNAFTQLVRFLYERELLPLYSDSPALPYLIKLLGFIFGDGTLYFQRRTRKGVVAFYGQPEDLEMIRRDLERLGFSSATIRERRRQYRIRTGYAFEQDEYWISIHSTALALLLVALGVPIGPKAAQDFALPSWLGEAPLWQKRLFLAAYFGAEMSTPAQITRHGYNLVAPLISLNKRAGYEQSGFAFLEGIAHWLAEFGVESQILPPRREQLNADGHHSIRLRLVIPNTSENLITLWRRIGFEYNAKKQAEAALAVQYLLLKRKHLEQRARVAEQARVMHLAGIGASEIYEKLMPSGVNQRFLQHSLYERRATAPRVGREFPTFAEFKSYAGEDLGNSGLVWDRIERIEHVPYTGPVYDLTMDHPDHNFVAAGFLVSNCGVRLLASGIEYEAALPYMDTLATLLNEYCPSGVGSEGVVKVSGSELDKVLREGARWALKNGYATEADLQRTEEFGMIEGADPSKVSERAKQRGREQIGSLGAGNHFIEVDVVEQIFDAQAAAVMGLQEGCLAVQIHCGSRGLGHQVCTDYVQSFQHAVKRYGIQLPDRELVCAPMDSPEGQDYLKAMRAAANFAFANRQLLAHSARRAFEETFAPHFKKGWHLVQVYDIAHNMGKIETHEVDGRKVKVCVHRKGATRAFGPGSPGLPPEYRAIGQPVIIPGSMGTASWVLVGTEESMSRSFGSTCHGAGRVMSRAKAKKDIRGEELRRKLEGEGIKVRAGSLSGLAEEAPQAYKNVDRVVETVSHVGIARKVARLRPVAVIKG